jgi:ubiquinol-cytochrome c reductase cytochrome c subunit
VTRRWLTRRSRIPPSLRALAAIVLGALGLIGIAAPAAPGQQPPGRAPTPVTVPSKLPDGPGAGNPVARFPSSPALINQGRQLFAESCSACHGLALRGIPRVAPSLIGVGPGPVDFYLSTGRMPLQDPRDEPERAKPQFDREQINSLIAYVSTFGGPPAPAVDPAAGNLSVGQQVFTSDCAGCHQIVARGGLTLGAFVPNLQRATAQQIAEAVRMGPYVMPRFGAKQIDQRQLNSLARYVLWTRSPYDPGGWGIYNIGPIPEGIVAWFIAITAMVIVARLIGERMA